MEISWKRIEKKDKNIILHYYEKEQPMSCEMTYGNNILWEPFFLTKYAVVEDMLVFLSNEDTSVSFPIGKGNVKKTVGILMDFFKEKSLPFHMHGVTESQFAQLETLFPETFEISYDRDAADYIYEAEKLKTLAGKKLHAKRNHINKFMENHPDWSYEAIADENRLECLQMAEKWWQNNGSDNVLLDAEAISIFEARKREIPYEDFEKRAEFEVTKNALLSMEELGLKGGLIRADGEVVAFSIGEAASEQMFVVHVEKAFADVQGAYSMINQQLVMHEAEQYTYVNREEDAGVEGLRKAKLSYRPAILLLKGNVTRGTPAHI